MSDEQGTQYAGRGALPIALKVVGWIGGIGLIIFGIVTIGWMEHKIGSFGIIAGLIYFFAGAAVIVQFSFFAEALITLRNIERNTRTQFIVEGEEEGNTI